MTLNQNGKKDDSNQRATTKTHPDLENQPEVEKDPKSIFLSPEMPPGWLRVFVLVSLTVVLLLSPLYVLIFLHDRGDMVILARDHSAAVFGVPWAGGASLVVVMLFRSSFGDIRLKILGQVFQGASGPIIMWVICFFAEVFAIGYLWNLK